MKKITINFGIILLASFLFQAYAQVQPDEKLFQDAKILIFDKEWENAQGKLEKLLEEYPESRWFSQALFYKGKCLEEQKGKEIQALQVYKNFLKLKDRNKSLTEEAEISIIELASRLYKEGKSSSLGEIERRLSSPNRVIKYYAAFQLSSVKDKKVARRAIPVLKEIMKSEKDDEIRDRARIAMLRVEPDMLKDFEEESYERKERVLKIRVFNKGKKEADFSVNIPWALADLALSAIPEKEKEKMRKERYNLDKIIKELNRFKGNIIEIKGEDSIIKIWID